MILAERAARLVSEIAVERLKLEVARLRRERFGASSERSARIDQLELTLEDLEETLAETDAQAVVEPDALPGEASSRRKPARRPLPEHLPRERVVCSRHGPNACDESRDRSADLFYYGRAAIAAYLMRGVITITSPSTERLSPAPPA
ncbi:transposase [Methylobacterium sp. E-025]|uniref:transposase n=1 Tax=Methylobacterium sp. E-025 TaxID=2836561 RepID=UPI001FBA9065|nr:transposase [Methylobacterium sp. E-025]MCJ2110297.1 transposase [Methylobacterium sp. E-025]